MIAVELLADLRQQGIELFVVDGALRYRAPRRVVTPAFLATLSEHKAELVALLTPRPADARLDPTDCLTLLDAMHAEIRRDYVQGALGWAFGQVPELKRRFHETEAVIDRLAGTRPTEADFRQALAAHASVWREITGRYRAQQERGDRL